MSRFILLIIMLAAITGPFAQANYVFPDITAVAGMRTLYQLNTV